MSKAGAKVYFIRTAKEPLGLSLKLLERVLDESGILQATVSSGDTVAIKTHFGERSPGGFVRPEFLAVVVASVLKLKGRPFVTDSNTLYRGQRADTLTHLKCASSHGFGIHTLGAPVVISGGIMSERSVSVKMPGTHIEEASIVEDMALVDSVVVTSHFKGHQLFGFGGSLKNLGMGSASRRGKLQMHSTVRPYVSEGCTACGLCVRWCPANAISLADGVASIDPKMCIGCAECIAFCFDKVIRIRWDQSSLEIQYRLVDYVSAVSSRHSGKICYINFLFDLTPLCDCMGGEQEKFCRDIGIMCSLDPVALDRASVDMVNRCVSEQRGLSNAEVDIFGELHPNTDWRIQLDYAEQRGIGTTKYEIIEIECARSSVG